MRGRSYSYSPSPPRGYSRRGRSPSPKDRYGYRSRDAPTSLLVRNLHPDYLRIFVAPSVILVPSRTYICPVITILGAIHMITNGPRLVIHDPPAIVELIHPVQTTILLLREGGATQGQSQGTGGAESVLTRGPHIDQGATAGAAVGVRKVVYVDYRLAIMSVDSVELFAVLRSDLSSIVSTLENGT